MDVWQRGGNYLHQRLSKLYSDTKQSYEEAKVIPLASPSIEEYPDVIALRKDFTIQQDRLLAWGMHWADVGLHASSSYLKGQDVNIDKKIDQAGLGDVVASVMEEIKRLLDESGKLQHPERYELTKKPVSPRLQRKEWKEYEVQTGRFLLNQLTSCIDVLYELVEGQKTGQPTGVRSKGMSVDEAFGTPSEDAVPPRFYSHPLYIDFASLAPMHDPDAAAEPPSYDDAQDNSGIKARSIYFYPAAQVHVVVDLVSIRAVPTDQDANSPLQQLHNLSDKLSGSGLLSWDGHLKLLGFTVVAANSRFGLVYALPAPKDQTALQQYQTLSATIISSCDHETSTPPLENRFRLAYNVVILAIGYLAHDSTHGYINSSNVLFLRENGNENTRQLGNTVRSPYLLQPIKKVTGMPASGETQSESIYHHPEADEAGYGTVAAYDIYSLGLVLLELGLWVPIRKFWKPKYDRNIFAERLRRIYSPKLASKCGSRYMKAVQKCLDAPTELADKPGTIAAAEYLLQVVRDLAVCCAIDESEEFSGLDTEIFEALIEEQKTNLPPLGGQGKQIKRKPVGSGPLSKIGPNKETAETKNNTRPRGRRRHTSAPGQPGTDNPGLKKFPDIPIPPQHLTEWNEFLMPKLSKLLNQVWRGSEDSASASLMMLGPTPELAKTTICIQCSDTAKARDMISKRFKPKRGWAVIIVKGDVRRSGRHRTSTRKSRKPKRSAGSGDAENEEARTKQQGYQKRPGPGASIGAFKDGEHLPPVSFGGTILVDGEMFGMTVHHMLDDPSDESDSDPEEAFMEEEEEQEEDELEEQMMEAVKRSMASNQRADDWSRSLHAASVRLGFDEHSFVPPADPVDEEQLEYEDYESDSDASTIRPDYSILDDDGTEHWFLDDSEAPDLEDDDFLSGDEDEDDDDDDDDDAASVGDIPGIAPFTLDMDDLCVTQPALDDVDDDFFPSIEDRDDDHLASHAFGHVHASSGIKRVIAGGHKHEIDWALIRVNEERRHNQLSAPKTSSKARPRSSRSSTSSDIRSGTIPEPQLTAISTIESLPNTPVICIARTSGPSQGRISPALALVKLHGRVTASASYTVDGGFGLPGDSGAWIWSDERNELCGHVLAYSHVLQQAYMAPMEVLVEDIRRTLNAAKVELPAEAALNASIALEQTRKGKRVLEMVEGHVQGHARAQRNPEFKEARELEVALAGLTMGEGAPRHPKLVPSIQRIEVKPSGLTANAQPNSGGNSNSSSASSGYLRTVAADSMRGHSTKREPPGPPKERFDVHIGAGAGELQSLPMARALS